MPANRTAALGATAAAIATALITVLGAINTLEQAIVVCVALLAIGAIAIVFLIGSQRSEKLTATWPGMPGIAAPPAAATLVEDPDVDDIPADELPDDDEEFAAPPPALDDESGSTLADPPQEHAP